MKFPIQCV